MRTRYGDSSLRGFWHISMLDEDVKVWKEDHVTTEQFCEMEGYARMYASVVDLVLGV